MQLSLFRADDGRLPYAVDLTELFGAYESCLRHKRKTAGAQAFALDYEENLMQLKEEMESGRYRPSPCHAFIVRKPVMREIFAADFRDRVVHHWLIARINHLFEQLFIEDSYACRVGKGTLYGIRRVEQFMHRATEGYTRQAYVLRLDIEGFFMNINRHLLFDRLVRFLEARYTRSDLPLLVDVLQAVVFSQPTEHCIIKGHRNNWKGLPPGKSLFHSRPGCGLPIGNLSSQILANFYLHTLDVFINTLPGLVGYGRYVDDFVLVHRSREVLSAQIPRIRNFLESELGLRLHPHKIYLQDCAHGLKFLGAVIRPGRIVAGQRVRKGFMQSVARHNRVVGKGVPDALQKKQFQNSLNSYLGLIIHFASYRMRRTIVRRHVRVEWLNYFYPSGGCRKWVAVVRRTPKSYRGTTRMYYKGRIIYR